MLKKINVLLLALGFTWSAAVSQVNLSQGLIGEYPFTKASLLDVSGNNVHMNKIGAQLSPDQDRFGNDSAAIRMQGVGYPAILGTMATQLPSGSGSRTISLWMKIKDQPGTNNVPATVFLFFHGVQATGAGFGLALNAAGQLILSGFQSDLAVSHPFAAGQWYHLAATYGNSVASLYINGIPVAQGVYAWNTPPSVARLGHLATSSTGGQAGQMTYVNAFRGSLDDVRIYNRVLNPSEIAALTSASIAAAPEESAGPAPWQIYPNPVSGSRLYLTGLSDFAGANAAATVYDLTGRPVAAAPLASVRAAGLDVRHLPAGAYLLQLPGSRAKRFFKTE